MGHFLTALIAGKMLEVLTASGHSESGLSWQSEVGDNIFIDAVVNRSGRIVKVSSATAWSFQEAPRRPNDVCPSSDRHTSERKYLSVVNSG
jgi:hypothetical protein